jgi:hypothetical protein
MTINPAELKKALGYLELGDWQAAHEIVQRDEESSFACWAHGIVHIMEGDLPNARYWYREAKRELPVKPSAAVEIRALKAAIAAEE